MRRLWRRWARGESGQTAVEYGILYAGVIVPLTFGIIFVAEMLWVWHSVVDFTREGARYATTHCWTANGDNVLTYMRTHVPRMIDQNQFQQGQAEIPDPLVPTQGRSMHRSNRRPGRPDLQPGRHDVNRWNSIPRLQ